MCYMRTFRYCVNSLMEQSIDVKEYEALKKKSCSPNGEKSNVSRDKFVVSV